MLRTVPRQQALKAVSLQVGCAGLLAWWWAGGPQVTRGACHWLRQGVGHHEDVTREWSALFGRAAERLVATTTLGTRQCPSQGGKRPQLGQLGSVWASPQVHWWACCATQTAPFFKKKNALES